MFHGLAWLLQWPIRALLLLLVSFLPLGVELETFPTALISAIVIGLLSTLPAQLLRMALAPAWFLTSVGGLLKPVSFLFDWLIMAFLFGLAAWLVPGFRLRNGLMSAILGALVYSVASSIVLHLLGL